MRVPNIHVFVTSSDIIMFTLEDIIYNKIFETKVKKNNESFSCMIISFAFFYIRFPNKQKKNKALQCCSIHRYGKRINLNIFFSHFLFKFKIKQEVYIKLFFFANFNFK